MASDVTRIIGIDFGTSTSVVRVKRYKNGEPVGDSFFSAAVTFGNGQGDNKAVTAVRRNSDGSFTCGREAEDMAPDAEIFREFKMDLESPDEAKRAEARALTEEFFKYLYRWYDHQRSDMGEAGDTEKTLVSFPVKWTEDTRRFMVESAQKAGFPDVTGMDEPTAALYATLTRKMNDVSAKGLLRAGEPGYMLLIDMGAGTSDFAVCRYTVESNDGIIRAGQIKNEIVATWPESAGAPTFGGREVDRLLEDYLTDYLSSCGLDGSMARQLVCGTASVKPWKENTVSALLGEGKQVDTCGFISGYMMLLPQKKPFPAIDREKIEAMLGEKLAGFQSLVAGCLDKACAIEPDVAQNGLDLAILTGGHSSWYFTEELLNGTMSGISHQALNRVRAEKDRVMRLSNPQETVALGLVYSLLPLKVEKARKAAAPALQWPSGGDEDYEALTREFIAENPGPTVPYERARTLADRLRGVRGGWEPEDIIAVLPEDEGILTPLGLEFSDSRLFWFDIMERDWPAGTWMDALCQRLRRRCNFLWRYDPSQRPKWPDVPDHTLYMIARYFLENHKSGEGGVELLRYPLSNYVRLGNRQMTWHEFVECDLGDAPQQALDLQSYLVFHVRDNCDPKWLRWPAVSVEDYGDLVALISESFGWTKGDNPMFAKTPMTEPTVREIMKKWRMCPDQPVYAVAPASEPSASDGLIFCRDGFCGISDSPASWEHFLELDVGKSSDLASLQRYLRTLVHYKWEDAAAPVWPDVSDEVIGALMRIYAKRNMRNSYRPTARELPYYDETVDALTAKHNIPWNENIIAVIPDRSNGKFLTERGFYGMTGSFTWRTLVEDDKAPETGFAHDVQVYLRGLLQYGRTAGKAGSAPIQSETELFMLDTAKKFFMEWPARHKLDDYQIVSVNADAGILRWNSKSDGKEGVSVTVSEEGIRTHYIDHESKGVYGYVSWDSFLSGTIERVSVFVQVCSEEQELQNLMSSGSKVLADHMAVFFVSLQTALLRRDELAKSGHICYVWDDRLVPKAKAFIEKNRKLWPELFRDPSRMALFRQTLRIPYHSELFLICVNDTMFKRNYGKDGWAFGEEGIYSRQVFDPVFSSWEEFLNGPISKGVWDSPDRVDSRIRLTPTQELVFLNKAVSHSVRDEVFGLIVALQDYLRKESLRLPPRKQ